MASVPVETRSRYQRRRALAPRQPRWERSDPRREPVSKVQSGCPQMTVAARKRRAENPLDHLGGTLTWTSICVPGSRRRRNLNRPAHRSKTLPHAGKARALRFATQIETNAIADCSEQLSYGRPQAAPRPCWRGCASSRCAGLPAGCDISKEDRRWQLRQPANRKARFHGRQWKSTKVD